MSQTILIVDDFASVRLYHSSFLRRKGYHCLNAGNGREALQCLRQNSVDLILLDMMMPVMDGESLLAAIADDPVLGRLPVLAITSEAPLAPGILPARPGRIQVLAKPVVPDTLLESVTRLLAPAGAAVSPVSAS